MLKVVPFVIVIEATVVATLLTVISIVANGDVINLAQKSGLEDKVVELIGEFVRPGFYSLSPGETVMSVINRAGVSIRDKSILKEKRLSFS